MCITKTNNKRIVFSENKSKFEVVNDSESELERHQVDGCLITDGVRCDWKMVEPKSGKEVYIELKGANVEHAVSQIVASIEKLTNSKAQPKVGYVICTRSPLSSSAIQGLVKKVRQSHNLTLRVKKTVFSATVDQVYDF